MIAQSLQIPAHERSQRWTYNRAAARLSARIKCLGPFGALSYYPEQPQFLANGMLPWPRDMFQRTRPPPIALLCFQFEIRQIQTPRTLRSFRNPSDRRGTRVTCNSPLFGNLAIWTAMNRICMLCQQLFD